MNSINAIKIGRTINLSVNGKLENKTLPTIEEANELFQRILPIKADPTDENIKKLYLFINDKTRIATVAGLEFDVFDNQVYLEGFNTPIPNAIAEIIKDYHDNKFPYESIISFWKLLMICPDARVHKSLFDFIAKFNMVLTTHGYFLAYKAVRVKEKDKPVIKKAQDFDADYVKFIETNYNTVRNEWKCSPKKYIVYSTAGINDFRVTKGKTFDKWADPKKTYVGTLAELYEQCRPSEDIEEIAEKDDNIVYTDKYTRKMSIRIGEPAYMESKECDGDPAVECSRGLHVGSTKYVEGFADRDDTILACLVNPAHVIAVPDHDKSKMRVSQYYPFAVVGKGNTISTINDSYLENGYIEYEKGELAKMIEKIKLSQLPIESSIGCPVEDRPLSELQKIIESRLIDLQ